MTAWWSVAVPVVVAVVETFKDNLPLLAPYLSGWRMVAAACAVSAVNVALRTRRVGRDE